MIGQVATAQEVIARWAYGEIVSSRFAHLFGDPRAQGLRQKAVEGVPFDVLPSEDVVLLADLMKSARNAGFVGIVERHPTYEVTGWTREQLFSAFALPVFNPQRVNQIFPYSEFLRGLPKPDANGNPDTTDPRTAVSQLLEPLAYLEPGIIIDLGVPVLLDGYFRSLAYLKFPPEDGLLPVWVPRQDGGNRQ